MIVSKLRGYLFSRVSFSLLSPLLLCTQLSSAQFYLFLEYIYNVRTTALQVVSIEYLCRILCVVHRCWLFLEKETNLAGPARYGQLDGFSLLASVSQEHLQWYEETLQGTHVIGASATV